MLFPTQVIMKELCLITVFALFLALAMADHILHSCVIQDCNRDQDCATSVSQEGTVARCLRGSVCDGDRCVPETQCCQVGPGETVYNVLTTARPTTPPSSSTPISVSTTPSSLSTSFSASTPPPVSTPSCNVKRLPECAGAGGVSGALLSAAQQYFAAAQCSFHEPFPANAVVPNNTQFDFIVVGAGTGGSVVAARLTDADFKVLLIEAGPDPPNDCIIPGLHGTSMATEYDWNLKSVIEGPDGASKAFIGDSHPLHCGKMLGGTGNFNDMVWSRGFPEDYDDWALTAGDKWSWTNVLPYFKKSEHLTDERIINDKELMKLHGRNGEIEVSGFNESTFETDMFLKAFEEAGYDIVKDLSNPYKLAALRAGRHSHTIRDGRRESTLMAFLNKAAKKNNLSVLKNAFVTKIQIENMSAVGVEVKVGLDNFVYTISKEVVVSAGAYHTPQLLMLSGIGPEQHLRNKSINVVKNLPVGQNLQDHIMVLSHITADNGTCYTDTATALMNAVKYFYNRSGPLSYSNTMTGYIALNDSTQRNLPDFAFYPSCLPMGTPFYDGCVRILQLNEKICAHLNDKLEGHELISVATELLKPKSTGRVELNSSNPLDAPLIYTGIFNDLDDLSKYPEAIDNVVKTITKSSYFKRMNASVVDYAIEPCAGFKGDLLVKCKVKAMAMSAFHPAGTAALGSVVDDTLRVYGISNLRVADASVMPKLIRGNLNAVIVMIAEKASDFIKDRWSKL